MKLIDYKISREILSYYRAQRRHDSVRVARSKTRAFIAMMRAIA